LKFKSKKTNDTVQFLVEDKNIDVYWDCIQKMCTYMCRGLSKLQETYEYGNVVYSIQFYINLIMDALEGKYTKEKLPMCMTNSENLLSYDKIKDLWDYKRVKEICELYDKCFDVQKDIKETEDHKREKVEGYLHATEHLLNISDEEFRNIIEKEDDQKSSP